MAEPARESRVLRGTFRIDRKIGSGAFGTVYAGTQLGLDKAVAIKLLMPEAFKVPGTIERFQREALLASKISHPVMAQVLDFGVEDTTPFLVMEFVDGREVAEVLATDGPFAPSRAIAIMRQLASLLGEVHGQGIVHRDLKPANLKLLRYTKSARQVHLKVLDFGIAKDTGADVQQSLTATGSFVGTPRYMSPEQVKGAGIDARSDLYSCGVILYELLTGDAPFRATSLAELIAHLLYDPPSPLPERFHPVIRETVSRLLEKDPNQRFPDAAALDAALERCEAASREPGFDDLPLPLPLGFSATAAGSAGAYSTAGSGTASRTGQSGAGMSSNGTRPGSIDPMGATSAAPLAGAVSASAISQGPRRGGLIWALGGAAVVAAAAAVLFIVHPWGRDPPAPPPSALAGAEARGPAQAAPASAQRPGASMQQPTAPTPAAQPAPPQVPNTFTATAGPGSFAPPPSTAIATRDATDGDVKEVCEARLEQARHALEQLRFKKVVALTKGLLADKAARGGGACDTAGIHAMAFQYQCRALCQSQDIKGYQGCLHSLNKLTIGKNVLTPSGFSVSGAEIVSQVQDVCNKYVQP